jgi:hypothetical protein
VKLKKTMERKKHEKKRRERKEPGIIVTGEQKQSE